MRNGEFHIGLRDWLSVRSSNNLIAVIIGRGLDNSYISESEARKVVGGMIDDIKLRSGIDRTVDALQTIPGIGIKSAREIERWVSDAPVKPIRIRKL